MDTVTTRPDTAANCPETARTAAIGVLGSLTTPERQIAPSEQISPIHSSVSDQPRPSFVVTTADPGFDKEGEAWINGYRFVPISTLVARIADLETERDALREIVERKNNRITALEEADECRRVALDTAKDAANIAIKERNDMRAERDAAAENARNELAKAGEAETRAEYWANECGKARKAGHDATVKSSALVAQARAAQAEAVRLHEHDLREWYRLWRPANVDALIERRRAGEDLDGAETAEITLWAHDREGKAIRFVAELATMTDVEADFLDGHEVRSVARLLQVPDMDGEVEATLPRLYSDEDRGRAADEVSRIILAHREGTLGRRCFEYVDAVAQALGMRRAG